MELACNRYPKRPRPKLLFLHGMGGTGSLWRPIAADLEEEFDILAPDQRGHGRSRQGPGYSPLDYGGDLVDTLKAQDFHPVFAIGHSMGVRSACALGHLKPEWVQGLCLVDLGLEGAAGGGLGDDLATFLVKLPMRFESRAEARAFMEAECPDPSIAQYLMAVSVLENDSGKAIVFPFDKDALIQTIEAARNSSVREWVQELGERGTPVLVLRGAQSRVWSHDDYLREKSLLAGYSSIHFEEIEGTGHGLPFEKRLEFVARLRKWIAGARA